MVITGLIIILCLVGGFAIWLVIMSFALKRVRAVAEKFRGRKVLNRSSSASFFGLSSRGFAQLRGNGVLILTEDELYFEMWIPKRMVQIPVSSVVKVETPKSHLGRTRFRPLLKVVFKDRSGKLDSAAWLVKDLNHWKENLEQLIPKNSTKGE